MNLEAIIAAGLILTILGGVGILCTVLVFGMMTAAMVGDLEEATNKEIAMAWLKLSGVLAALTVIVFVVGYIGHVHLGFTPDGAESSFIQTFVVK